MPSDSPVISCTSLLKNGPYRVPGNRVEDPPADTVSDRVLSGVFVRPGHRIAPDIARRSERSGSRLLGAL
jgi:hypothetical protein